MSTLDSIFETRQSSIARDLRLNLSRILEESSLSRQESYLCLLATATSVEAKALMSFAQEELKKLDFTQEQIQEASEAAAMMGMLNTYYRFRHMMGSEHDYQSAGLRMTALARPVLGKERFEMLAFAVSVINGCENCIRAHEKVLRDSGASADKVHDLARLASVVRGVGSLFV